MALDSLETESAVALDAALADAAAVAASAAAAVTAGRAETPSRDTATAVVSDGAVYLARAAAKVHGSVHSGAVHSGAVHSGSVHSGSVPPNATVRHVPNLPEARDGVAKSEARMLGAWREWLGALATDAAAAHAAAMAYKELEPEAREVWLQALTDDATDLGVPKIAVYAPLLAVEADPTRRYKIQCEIAASAPVATPRAAARALCGIDDRGIRVVAIISPLYLDFVEVVACGYRDGREFEWVRHDPILVAHEAPRPGTVLGQAVMESRPIKAVIDELAHTVLGHRRLHGELPQALQVLSDLFAPDLDESAKSGD